jgi:hypothetical protein
LASAHLRASQGHPSATRRSDSADNIRTFMSGKSICPGPSCINSATSPCGDTLPIQASRQV